MRILTDPLFLLYGDGMNETELDKRINVYDWIESVAVALSIVIIVLMFFCKIYTVKETSMFPTLENNSKIIALNAYAAPKVGDVVVFENEQLKEALIKRVIGVPGDEVMIDGQGQVFVNGILTEYVASGEWNLRGDQTYPLTVPDGCFFVMGDNRGVSLDSRDTRVGFVRQNEVCAVAKFVLFPVSKIGVVK